MTATQATRAGAGRRAVPGGPGTTLGDDDDTTIHPLPSTEPLPGAQPAQVHHARAHPGPARTPLPDEPDEVPVPARRSAHALVVMALEIVDRKRAPTNVRGAFPEHLVEMLRSLARTGVPGRHLGTARIHRLHIHPAGGGAAAGSGRADAPAEYEVCATYARGPRLFAVAARIRVTPTGASCLALRMV